MKTKPKILTGVVVANQTAKTLTVRVDRLIKHRRYGKYLRRSKLFLVQADSRRELGERVRIRSTRPWSRHKHFELV